MKKAFFTSKVIPGSFRLLFLLCMLSNSRDASGTNYYWIGGSGNWSDLNHWATTSGGTTFQSVAPTAGDNVIFDAGSGFSISSQTVTVDVNAFCDSMNWQGVPAATTFVINNPLQVNGSLTFQPGMIITGATNTSNSITFASTTPNESITTGNNILSNTTINFNGAGGWNFLDSFKMEGTGYMNFTDGNLNFNGQYVRLYTFSSSAGNSTRTLNIANTVIDVGGFPFGAGLWNYSGGAPLTAPNSTQSSIRINSGTSLQAKPGDVYYKLTFLSNSGVTATIHNGVYSSLSFINTGGDIINSLTADTLLFTPGYTYWLGPGTTTTVNNVWYASGTPCALTDIQAYISGLAANISMPATAANYPPSTYGIDFVRMSDIHAVTGAGNAAMQLGNQSIDSGNNTNWTIIPYTGLAGFTGLGNDTTLYCSAFPFTLNTVAFQGSPATAYLWDNGSTSATRSVATAGTYNVAVNYGSGCTLSDTITLSQVAPPTLAIATTVS